MKRKFDSIAQGAPGPLVHACGGCGLDLLATTPGTPKTWPWAVYEAVRRLHDAQNLALPHVRAFSLGQELLPFLEANANALCSRKPRGPQLRKSVQQTLSKHATLFVQDGADRWTLQPAATQLHGKPQASPRHRKENQPSFEDKEDAEESSIDLLGEYHDDDALEAPLPLPPQLLARPHHPAVELRDEDISNVDDSDIEIPDYMEDDDLDLLADSQSQLHDSQSLHSEADEFAHHAASPRKRRRLDSKPSSPLTSSTTFKEEPPTLRTSQGVAPSTPQTPRMTKHVPTQTHLVSPKIPEKELTEPYVPISLRRRQPRDLFEYAVEEEEEEESEGEMEVKFEPVELHFVEGDDMHVEDGEDEDDGLDDDEVFIEVIPKFLWDSIVSHPFMYKDRTKKKEAPLPDEMAKSNSEETGTASDGPAPPTPFKAHHSIDSSDIEEPEEEDDEESLELSIDILGEDSSESEMDCAGHLIVLTPAVSPKKKSATPKTPKEDHRMHDAPSLGQLLQAAVEIPVFRPVADYDVPPLKTERGKKKSPSRPAQPLPPPSSGDSSSEDEMSDSEYLKLHRKAELKEKAAIRSFIRARKH